MWAASSRLKNSALGVSVNSRVNEYDPLRCLGVDVTEMFMDEPDCTKAARASSTFWKNEMDS